jgi:hypothetical protein
MALTLRRTNLAPVPAFEHLEDWTVFEDSEPIGRIYQPHAPHRSDVVWYWTCTIMSPARLRVKTEGHEVSFGQAKARFLASYQALRQGG